MEIHTSGYMVNCFRKDNSKHSVAFRRHKKKSLLAYNFQGYITNVLTEHITNNKIYISVHIENKH